MNLNLSTKFQDKKTRERFLAFIIFILILIFSIIEFKLINVIRPLPKYSNVFVFVVININLILILTLSFLVIRNLVKLLFEENIHIIGIKLKRKLTVAFIIISLLPTILLFFISLQFLQTSLRYWFDIKIEKSLEQAISIGRNFYNHQIDYIKDIEDSLVNEISIRCIDEKKFDTQCIDGLFNPASLDIRKTPLKKTLGINLVQVIEKNGKVIWKRQWLPLTEDLAPPEKEILKNLGKKNLYHIITHEIPSGSLINVVRPIFDLDSNTIGYLLIGKILPQEIASRLEDVKKGYEEYKQLKLFQDPLKTSLLSSLFLITLLIIFVSIWLALKLAKSITEPVQMLADATQRIAHGDLDFHLDIKGRDELSGLVKAFNIMTQDLKEAKTRAEEATKKLLRSYSELENRKAYIEMLLEHITTGVISLDRAGKITTINKSACEILERDPNDLIGLDYKSLLKGDELSDLESIPKELSRSGKGTIKRSIRLEIGDQVKSLLINFSLLKDKKGRTSGMLIVFEDLTDLERIQRLAAWRDVARRIAHEIKNPLTPIKLSAQRLRRKFKNFFSGDNERVFESCTKTIIDQADELKRLVDEFSKFARMPAPELRLQSVLPIIEQVKDMYSQLINISFEVSDDFPKIMIDEEQIKRCFINIIDNSINAGKAKNLKIKCTFKKEQDVATISIEDDGIGINKKDLQKVFDPYYTRRKGGTGLGLSIVKSIIDAHNAKIAVEPNRGQGVKFIITFTNVVI